MVLCLLAALSIAFGATKITTADAPAPIPVILTIPQLIHHYADKYGVSEIELTGTINCESGFDPNAIGDLGTSFGLSQIHLPAHPDITKAQALDPDFAIQFMAEQFSEGNAKIWTCARMLHYVK